MVLLWAFSFFDFDGITSFGEATIRKGFPKWGTGSGDALDLNESTNGLVDLDTGNSAVFFCRFDFLEEFGGLRLAGANGQAHQEH